MTDAVSGGLAEPVLDAQRVFRAVMDALARPGRIVALPRVAEPPAPLPAAAGAVLATLADEETPVWLGAGLGSPEAAGWLAFHTGAATVADPAAARFAVVRGADLRLDAFAQGTPEYPDRSATVLVLLDTLEGGPPLVLAGPGIAGTAALAPAPLPADFAAAWAANGRAFPCGVDLVLMAGDLIAGLPRSTRLEASRCTSR